MQKSFAQVVIEKKHWPLDKVLDYAIPDSLINDLQIGHKVLVPLQRKQVPAYVVGIIDFSELEKVRQIIGLLDSEPYFDHNLLSLAYWIKDYYLCSLGDALHSLLPPIVKIKEKRVWAINFPFDQLKEKVMGLQKKSPKQAKTLEIISQHDGKLSAKEIEYLADTGPTPLKSLETKGLIREIIEEIERTPLKEIIAPDSPLQLNSEQEKVLQSIEIALDKESSSTFLLHGVTGSGKTEVYLQSIAYAIKRNKEAIVLVPEISLTPQTVERFRKRFGQQIAIWHSNLSAGEKYDQWRKIKKGQIKVVVGARSALFAPLPNLGIIIIDEEHESTYKQEENPKYHAREVAQKRMELVNGVLLLGTATPGIETYYRSQSGKYQYLSLTSRIENKPLPQVEIVDMRLEMQQGNKRVFSQALIEAIQERLDNKEQTILFLNRRGFSTFVLCRECGLVLSCPNCNVSLIYHSSDSLLKCHYCHYKQQAPDLCPRCSSRYIRYFGTGTQKVEDELSNLFPKARVLRMDADTTTRKDSHTRMLKSFADGEIDILLGTQMIAKGLDFPRVTLVGVVTADTLLNFPDFRAGEKTFQLLTQVAGRAGRGQLLGKVIIQTYCPDHYSIKSAKLHDFIQFYQQEIIHRKELGFPPFSYLAKLVVKGENEKQVIDRAQKAVELLSIFREEGEVLGPVPAPLSRVKGQYRWQIIIKSPSIHGLNSAIRNWWKEWNKGYHIPQVGIIIDIEPLSML